jgi:hypothetical protein
MRKMADDTYIPGTAYTEHDYVLKSANTEDILSECGLAGFKFSRAQEAQLGAGFEKARREDTAVSLPALNLTAGWDETRQEYYIIVKNMYEPRNLLDILYERLVWEKAENPEDEDKEIRAHIGNYLGVIEKREKVSLAETKEKLASIALDMRKTLAVYADGEYSDEDIERLSDSLDRTYFDPITELLEGVIIAIAGN